MRSPGRLPKLRIVQGLGPPMQGHFGGKRAPGSGAPHGRQACDLDHRARTLLQA